MAHPRLKEDGTWLPKKPTDRQIRKQQREESIGVRSFGGKIGYEATAWDKLALRAYLDGRKMFTHGFTIDPETKMSFPMEHKTPINWSKMK